MDGFISLIPLEKNQFNYYMDRPELKDVDFRDIGLSKDTSVHNPNRHFSAHPLTVSIPRRKRNLEANTVQQQIAEPVRKKPVLYFK
jgi:hypothetical protein